MILKPWVKALKLFSRPKALIKAVAPIFTGRSGGLVGKLNSGPIEEVAVATLYWTCSFSSTSKDGHL